ncbi:hypothetical protein QYE76_042603 [Lolium multiflorum]|uniref:Alpha/beta hydrolase fold-3 domain-containing protein n=1 Tax=Lolium multiflorum TaxID=4521 RepID=A0AAD8TF41_LOLMU|nr:hypothetical protein QYE76_042603 [Lolium multiflorum]
MGHMLVVAAERGFFRDRNVEYAERMKAMGKDVELVVFVGQGHRFFGVIPLWTLTASCCESSGDSWRNGKPDEVSV